MTLGTVLGVAALIVIVPPLLVCSVALMFGDIIVAYADSKNEGH